MTSRIREDLAIGQQIEDLRERMRVLQNDRKLNVDTLEQNKKNNSAEIEALRQANKALRSELAIQSKKNATVGGTERDEVDFMEREVQSLRKRNDNIHLKNTRLRKELDQLRDAVNELELNSRKPHLEDNEYTRQIRALENKLDKAMIKFNEATSIRKTYEQILTRLKEERVGFDYQLTAIERTLRAKERDCHELILLSADSTHARDAALVELDRVRAVFEEEKSRREREMNEQRENLNLRKDMMARMKLREEKRQRLRGLANQTNSTKSDAALASHLRLQKLESRNKVSIFENAFRKIKEATGVSDVNEVIQKILSQESTTENLIHVTRENQAKMDTLNEMKRGLKKDVEELKYSGVGGGQHRKMVDSYEDQLANASTRLERSKLKYERLNKVVIGMKAGIGHLQDKFESFCVEIEGRRYVISDETVADALRECDLCVEMLLKRIRATEEELIRAHHVDLEESMGPDSTWITSFAGSPPGSRTTSAAGTTRVGLLASNHLDDLEVDFAKLTSLRPHNQRIDITGHPHENVFLTGNLASEDANIEDEELSRENVKRASAQILHAMEKRNKKPKRRLGLPSSMEGDSPSKK